MTVIVFAWLPPVAASAAPDEESCPVVASAQGVQVMVTASDNLFLQRPSGVGVPVARACVDYRVAESSGFASGPYPGETLVSLPALLRPQAGEAGQSLPDYPAFAASRYPSTPSSTSEQPAYALRSHSTETSTRATARTGLEQDGSPAVSTAMARAAVDPDERVTTAAATTDTEPLTFGGVLSLGQIISTAQATVGADGKLVRTSQLQIGRTEVAGQVVEITADGVVAAGQAVPLPGSDPAGALQAAGIQVRYLRRERTSNGVLSAGVEVVTRHEDAQTGAVYTVHYIVGRAFASADEFEPSGDGGGGSPPSTAPAGDSPPIQADSPSGGGFAPTSASGTVPADLPPLLDSAVPPAAPEDGGPVPAVAPAVAARLVAYPADMGLDGLYLVIVCGAVAMFASGTLLRLLGVKTRWTS